MKLLNTYSMNDDNTRRQVFWLLKRLSSYSLWKRKRDAWAIFAATYEQAVKTWPENDPDALDPNNLVRIYEALCLYDQGIEELGKGHRHVWRTNGDLYQLYKPVDIVKSRFFGRYHERGIQEWPYPPKVEQINKLRLAEEYAGTEYITEPQDMVANITNVNFLFSDILYESEFYSLPRPIFPKNLPMVPNEQKKMISTGDIVPCDGIWEPGKLSLDFKWKVIPVGIGDFVNKGCFNYLISGARAPFINVFESHEMEKKSIEWRLIWEDTRYCDGTIPDESEYFLDDNPGKRITCRSGEHCPHSGRWATIAGGQQQFAHVEAGKLMPEAAQYQGDMFAPIKPIPATWKLLMRDDGGSVYIS
ncbi:Imm72 family immunity protein [Buttiauxella ferragutiae]|uniref:Imm72 family immunity protein n=1 Tax=Buttiauxella ferragutiae TaxID=82989 RepID=UPI001F531517|nr:Imm72 family immunity protein [Buttiauxella ferragutiae]UNK63181.1 Imm72 family immunity protein [Buttiauxella ferragutiae]